MTRHWRATISALVILQSCLCSADQRPDEGELSHVRTSNTPQAELAVRLWRGRFNAPGTLIMCHGFGRSMEDFLWYGWIRDRLGWNVIRFDFRQHGQSSRGLMDLPTLGYYEIWDLKAIVDWAEQQELPKPYVCYGHSMGAAIAMRWAARDQRISGVLAQSPFKNALDATYKYRPDDFRVQLAGQVVVRAGFKQMLEEVDIPKTVAARDDLLLWLTATRQDWFGEADQLEILKASKSPENLKRYELIPVEFHGDQWMWKGNDKLIEDFLAAASERYRSSAPLREVASPRRWRASIVGPGLLGIVAAALLVRRVMRARGR